MEFILVAAVAAALIYFVIRRVRKDGDKLPFERADKDEQ